MSQADTEPTEFTTISVPVRVKEELDESRQERPWGAYLEQLAEGTAFDTPDAVAEYVAAQVGEGDGLSYEDVVAACEQAMRNVLPDDVVQ